MCVSCATVYLLAVCISLLCAFVGVVKAWRVNVVLDVFMRLKCLLCCMCVRACVSRTCWFARLEWFVWELSTC